MLVLISIENRMDEWHTDPIQEIKRTNLEIKKPFEKSNEQILEIKKTEKSKGQILEIKKSFEISNGQGKNPTYNYFSDTPRTP